MTKLKGLTSLAGNSGGGDGDGVGRGRLGKSPAPGAASDRHELAESLDTCRRCELWRDATQAVGGEGPRHAPIMLVGEQPGDAEDLAGHPFVGPAGKLLDQALKQAGIARDKVYVTNAVKHFKWEPRGKRRIHKTPAQREIVACRFWLDEELREVAPKVVVALGATALKAVLRTSKATLAERLEQPLQFEDRWLVTVYHPSYVLRLPGHEAKTQAFDAMVRGLKKAASLSG
ncbi:MAG: uracil-DNA glycosylase [Herminiimonas sp.]|nr:uracil-DNA glycosylase [Herminiimonas sp.]